MPAAFILLFVLVRIVMAVSSESGNTSTSVPTPWLGYLVRGILLFIAAWLLCKLELAWGLPLLIAAYPTLLIEGVLVPSGLPALAFVATRVLRPPGVGAENSAAAFFYELRARARFGLLLREEWLERWETRLFGEGFWHPRGATVAARALLDATRGDIARARHLFNLGMNMRHATRSSRGFCQAWLMAEAAQRGDYTEVRRVARSGRRTLRARFMEQAASQLLGSRPRAPFKLYALWLLAPCRRHSYQLLRLALTTQPHVEEPAVPPGLPFARDASVALFLTPDSRVTLARLRRLAVAWQTVIDSGELYRHFALRLEALATEGDADALAAGFENGVTELLAEGYRRSLPEPGGVDATAEPPLLCAAIDLVRSRALDELDVLVEVLPSGETRSTDNIEANFREWAEIRYLAERYLSLFPNDGPTLYDAFGATLLNHGVWLNNRELAYPLACDVFRWLRRLVPSGHPDEQLLLSNERIARKQASAM